MMNQTKNEYWEREFRGEKISSHKSQISPLQKKEERVSHLLLAKAKKIEDLLKELLSYGNNAIDGVYLTKLKEGKYIGKTTFEFSSFDGTVVIRKDMRRKYLVDPGKIAEAATMLEKWSESVVIHKTVKQKIYEVGKVAVDKEEVTTTAFLDVLQLRTVYNDSSLEEALDKLQEGIISEVSDPYFRVYEEMEVKGDMGESKKILRLVNTSLSKL